MTVTFYAQPYDISATGFYFNDAQTYKENINSIRNDYGDIVEEFEIQFINGHVLDSKLARAVEPNQCNILTMMKAMEIWTEDQKLRVIIAVHEAGESFDLETSNPDDLEIDIYQDMKMSDLAYQFVDEGLFGEIPDNLTYYIDYDAIARDLSYDYSEINICGENYVYRLA